MLVVFNSCGNMRDPMKNNIKQVGFYYDFYTSIPMSTGSFNSQRKLLIDEKVEFVNSEIIKEIQLIMNNSKVRTVLPSKIGMKTLFATVTLKNDSEILIAVFDDVIIDVNNNISYIIENKSDNQKLKSIIYKIRSL